jgi:hypothetical protein
MASTMSLMNGKNAGILSSGGPILKGNAHVTIQNKGGYIKKNILSLY